MNNTRILFVTVSLVAFLPFAALAQEKWSDQFDAEALKPAQVSFPACDADQAKRDGGCQVIVAYSAQSKTTGSDGKPVTLQWTESWVVPEGALKELAAKACVMDDGPRPSGIRQTVASCTEKATKKANEKATKK